MIIDNMHTPITVVVIDDHPLIRHAVRVLVAEHDELTFVGEGTAGEHLFTLVTEHQPDVVILDLNMPQSDTKRNGNSTEPFQALPQVIKLHQQYPETAVIILSEHIVPGSFTMASKAASRDISSRVTTSRLACRKR